MLLDASFAPRPAFADECNTVRYSYDSSGRLVGVTDQLGQTARYGYDEVGNGTSVQNLSTPALSVMSVTPRSGAPGTAVTISGGCFSLSPAANLVQFNGTAATVTSASPARLVVIVPEGATTGPVTVTVGSASATSDVPFTIDPAANGPSITGVTPAVVNVGDTISVSGTNFDSDVSAQVAALNGTRAPVQNATTTGLDILAPSGTSSGRVSVRTARGTATGPDVYVAPSPYTAADVVTTARTSIGVPQTVSIPMANKIGLVLFDLSQGQRASITLSGGTFGSCGLSSVKVLDIRGTTVRSLGCPSNSDFIDTFTASATGTYELLFVAAATATGTITAKVSEVPADATVTASIGGAAVTVTSTVPGQNLAVTFTGTAGQRVFFKFTGNTFGCCLSTVVRKPDGSTLVSTSIGSSDSIDTTTLPVDGAYTIYFNPSGAPVGSVTTQLFEVPADAVATTSIGGPAVTLSTTTPGQNLAVTFLGTAGQRVFFKFTNNTFGCCLSTVVRKPDGSTLVSTSIGSSDSIDTTTLPVDGAYTIYFNPSGAPVGSVTTQLFEVPADATVAATIGGPAVTVTSTVPGQNLAVTFTGTAGQRVSFRFTGNTFGCCLSTVVRKPDGSTLVSTSIGSSGTIDPTVLPVDGTYTIYFNPSGSPVGSVTTQLFDVPADATATATIGGPAVTVSTTVPGQNLAVTFTGTAGQRVFFKFTNNTFGCCLSTVVRKPDGSTLVSTSISSADSIDTTTVPVDGTYTVYFNPSGSPVGSVTTQLFDVPADATATATIGGPAVTVSTTTPGQNAAVTFAGTAGQVVTVNLTGNTFGSTNFAVRKPDGTNLASTTTSSGSYTFSSLSLATTGTYTVYANPSGSAFGQVTVAVVLVGGGAAPAKAPSQAETSGATTTHGPAPTRTTTTTPATTPATTTPSGPVVDAALDPRRLRRPASDDSEFWTPDRFNLHGDDWESHRSDSGTQELPALTAGPGETAVTGQVLLVNGKPLAGVTLSIDDHAARSDTTGRFLITGLSAGHHELSIDGRTASKPGREFGVFEVGLDVIGGQTTVLPYTIWMTRLDAKHAVSFPSPTTAETVITTPKIPGFEVRLPKGSVVKDEDGHVVTSLSVTAIPVDRPPFPLPPGVVTPVYFTVQPGGSYVFPAGAQIVYPNSTGLAPGTRVEFWDYDPDVRGWYVYGHGTVTRDGKQVVPDPGVRVWEFSGAMINVAGLLKALFNMLNDFFHFDGDPVDLGTGLFEERHTDLTVPDVMPISVTRTYRQLDNARRPFGIGTNYDYGIFLQSAHQYTEADMVFPDSSSVHFVRTSPGTGFTDAVFAAVDTTGPFRNATMAWNGNGWDLRRTDGMVYVFGENQPLQAIRDRHGNQITVTHANGQGGNITQVTSPSGRWIKFSYDASNRITQAKDDSGRVVTYTYDAGGRLTQVRSPGGATITYGYDANNSMTTITDARNITYLTNTYNSAGKVATQRFADGSTYQFAYVTDANGYSTQTTVTAPDGSLRRATFDTSHYETAETVALGTPLERTVTITRDPSTHLVQSVTDPHGRSTTVTYDAAGNPSSVSEFVGVVAGHTTQFTYGAPYNQISSVTDWANRTSTFGYNAAGDVTAITDAANRTTQIEYDRAGRPTRIIAPLGHATTVTYDLGDPVAVTDPLGRTTRKFFDTVGRVAAVTDPTGARTTVRWDADNNVLSATDPLGHTTTFGHDANGNRTSVTDARGHTTTYTYDTNDRVTDRTDPLGHSTHVDYDVMGRPVTATDARGKKTAYASDDLGRLVFAGYGMTPGPTYESTVSYSYVAFDRRATAADSASGTTTFGYDGLDQLTSVTTAAGQVRYTYDDLGRRATMSVPGQQTITYGYDPTDLISSISQGSTSVTWQRDNAGRTSSISQPGVTTTFAYDAASQLTGMTFTGTGRTPIGDLIYSYDANGRVATLAGSLAHVTIPSTGPPVSYDNADQLVSRGGQVYSYDNAGNLTNDGTNTYAWDARGQLASVTRPGMSATYEYDSAGRRTGKTVNGTTTTYLYDGPNIVREQTSGSAIDRLTAGADETLQRSEGGTARSLVSDGLGSTLGLVDQSSSALSTQYSYDPYGAPTASGAASTNTQQYTGREYDAETGLQNNRARYYSPATGRFISRDPAGFGGGGTNLYEYAFSDPVNIADPNGDCPFCAAMAGGCVVGGVLSVALGWGLSSLEGRKYSVGDGFRDFGEGCVAGALFEFGGWAFRLGRLAGEARLISQLTHGFLDDIAATQRVTATLIARLDGQLIRIVGSGARDLTPAQRAFVEAMGWTTAKFAGHAEETVLAKAAELGAKPVLLAIYGGGKNLALPICEKICIPAITRAGGKLINPWIAIWW